MYIFKILAIVAAIFVTSSYCDQPSYQVSLYVKLHPKGPPIHLCNGAIIQSRIILTTAKCVHHQFSPNSPVIPLPSSVLIVISGSSTEFVDELTLGVTSVLVADNFNYTTGENDLALLRLSSALPLDMRTDMSWITLEDAENFEGPCVANYYVRNTMSKAPNYIQSEELPLLDRDICEADHQHSNAREDDICSLYRLPLGTNCNSVETLLQHNGDRGTGLVCENKLVGLLSSILPLQTKREFDCGNKPIKAFYTNLAPHLGWIFNVVSDEDMEMYERGEFISSLPYSGKNDAFEEPIAPIASEPESTSSLIGYNESSTKVPTAFSLHSAAPNHVYATIIVAISFTLQFFM